LKQELRQVKNERDQMSEDLINAENAFTDVKKRNEKLKLIINEHKTVRLSSSSSSSFSSSSIDLLEYGNVETLLGRIGSLHRRAETKVCRPQTTRTRETE
jgi:phage shock protein A